METTGNTAQSKINQTEVLPSTWNAYAVCQTVCTSECIILVSVPHTPPAPSHRYCLAYKWKIMGWLRICSVQDDLNDRPYVSQHIGILICFSLWLWYAVLTKKLRVLL